MGPNVEIWKTVPEELVFGISVRASSHGRVVVDGKEVKAYKGPKGRHGYYKATQAIGGKTMYFHRLVYWAFAAENTPLEVLNRSRVIFKAVEDPASIVDSDGLYRSHADDLLLEPFKDNNVSGPIPFQERVHPVYGPYRTGHWYPVKAHFFDKRAGEHKVVDHGDRYDICILDNHTCPCIIRNKERLAKGNMRFVAGQNDLDPMVSLSFVEANTKPRKYLVSHIILASVFDANFVKSTVDHIDEDATNNHIDNLQWLSTRENSMKGAKKKSIVRLAGTEEMTEQRELEGETWMRLSKNTEVSDKGRLRTRGTKYTLGSRLRGKKYRYASVTREKGKKIKRYVHQLVWMAFNGVEEIPQGHIVLHDDSVPLREDGSYRNWLCDLRVGGFTENGREYHEAKRNALMLAANQNKSQ